MNTEYYRLKAKEEVISGKMKALIENAIEENGGLITFRKDEDEDGGDDQEDYPVSTVLYGRKRPYRISITDVYLDNGRLIYADGMDDDTGCHERGFKTEPEQYSDILYFIACVLGWSDKSREQAVRDAVNSEMMELACALAEKEMVDRHNRLPEAFMDESGEQYTEDFQDEFNPLYDKYYDKLADLAGFEYTQG